MVKGVATCPVDEADVGIVVALAVVVERRARLLQHVGDARHRNEGLDRIAALRQGGAREPGVVVADHVEVP